MTRSASKTADLLLEMRRTKKSLPNLPDGLRPSSVDEAYAVQEVLVQRLLASRNDTLVGYKVACTSKAAQQLLNVNAPFHGQLFQQGVFYNGATLDSRQFTLRLAEPEFAMRMGRNVPPRDGGYSAETIRPFINAVLPAIEIADHRFDDFTKTGGLPLLADNAILGAVVLGDPVSSWEAFDLAACRVDFIINGEHFSHGTGANALGGPLEVMAWLANDLPRRDKQLRAGDIIMTGTVTAVHWSKPGDTIRAEFGDLGSVSFSFADA